MPLVGGMSYHEPMPLVETPSGIHAKDALVNRFFVEIRLLNDPTHQNSADAAILMTRKNVEGLQDQHGGFIDQGDTSDVVAIAPDDLMEVRVKIIGTVRSPLSPGFFDVVTHARFSDKCYEVPVAFSSGAQGYVRHLSRIQIDVDSLIVNDLWVGVEWPKLASQRPMTIVTRRL